MQKVYGPTPMYVEQGTSFAWNVFIQTPSNSFFPSPQRPYSGNP